MALPAGRFDVLCGKDWLLPRQRAAMRFFRCRSRSLATVTHRTSELVNRVRNDWVFPEWLPTDVDQARLFQSHVAGGAAVNDATFRQPDLLDVALEVALQRDRLASASDHSQVLLLIMAPLAE